MEKSLIPIWRLARGILNNALKEIPDDVHWFSSEWCGVLCDVAEISQSALVERAAKKRDEADIDAGAMFGATK